MEKKKPMRNDTKIAIVLAATALALSQVIVFYNVLYAKPEPEHFDEAKYYASCMKTCMDPDGYIMLDAWSPERRAEFMERVKKKECKEECTVSKEQMNRRRKRAGLPPLD